MAIEKFEFPASGTVLETWNPTANPQQPDFINADDLNSSIEESSGSQPYCFGAPYITEFFRRVYDNASEADRARFQNFRRVVGGNPFKFTDEFGIPHKVVFADYQTDYQDKLRDNWGFRFALRAQVRTPPSLSKIPQTLWRDLLFYAPLTTDLAAFGRWDVTANFARNSIATYLDPATGLIKQVAANIPRFDANGFLQEPTAVNRCLWSEDFSNAVWVKSNVTVGANDSGTTDPMGTQTADLLTASAGNGTVIQDLGTIPSSSKVFALYLKRKTGTGNVDITLDGGSTWTTVTINSSTWTRVSKFQTLANPDIGIRLVTSGDAVWAWGGHFEDGVTILSSYIPTTSAVVTRPGDVLSFISDGHALQAQGAGIFVVTPQQLESTQHVYFDLNDGTANTRHTIVTGSVASARPRLVTLNGGATQADLELGGGTDDLVAGTKKSLGLTWQSNDVHFFTSGVDRANDSSATMPAHTTIRLGSNAAGGNFAFANIRDLAIFARPLTAAEMLSVHNGII